MVFDDSLAFVTRNLHKIQAGRGVNAPGIPEIPESVFEELLVNALVHRDYLISAPIRLFIFDNRIEIISPGHLPNNLTVEKILSGNSNIRNPILVSYIAKGLLPYKGIGSGIRRALDDWQKIDFMDDREGCLFNVTVHRTTEKGSGKTVIPREKIAWQRESSGKGSEKSSGKILELLADTPDMTIPQLAEELGISTRAVEKQIAKSQKDNQLKRIGPARGGHWQVDQ